jgi:hypothetical protein
MAILYLLSDICKVNKEIDKRPFFFHIVLIPGAGLERIYINKNLLHIKLLNL